MNPSEVEDSPLESESAMVCQKQALTLGKLADLLVLSADPTNMEPEGIIDIAVMTTIIDGKVTWER